MYEQTVVVLLPLWSTMLRFLHEGTRTTFAAAHPDIKNITIF